MVLANMFIEIEDLMSIIKKTKHPTDSSVDSENKVLGTVLDKVSDISKSIKDISKKVIFL